MPALTLVIAHRGASAAFPENTVAAFRGAREMGADWVELDVRRTADGVLAVHHDAVLATGGPLADVAAVDLPAQVPLLDTALDACAGMGVNVEVKNASHDPDFDSDRELAAAVVSALAARRDRPPVLVSSFDLVSVDRVRALDADLATAWLVMTTDPTTVATAAERGHQALHPFVATVDAELVSRAHDAGLAVNVWTVDDPLRMGELAAMGVDGLVTNVPDVARRVLDAGGVRGAPG